MKKRKLDSDFFSHNPRWTSESFITDLSAALETDTHALNQDGMSENNFYFQMSPFACILE